MPHVHPSADTDHLNRRLLAAALLVGIGVLALATGGSVAAEEGPAIEDPAIENDTAVVTETKKHSVSFDVTNVDDDTNVTVTVRFSEAYDGVVAADGNVTVGNNSAKPSVDGQEVTASVNVDQGGDNKEVTLPIELTHPSTAGKNSLDEIVVEIDDDEIRREDLSSQKIEITQIGIDATFSDGIVDNRGDETTFDIEETVGTVDEISDTNVQLEVSADGLSDEATLKAFDADEQEDIVWNENAVSFDGVDPGVYKFEAFVPGTDASDTATIRVERAEVDASFGQDEYSTPAGDLVDVDVSVGADGGYVIIGGDRISDPDIPSGFLDVLHVDGGETITINTRLLGTSAGTDSVYPDSAVESHAHGNPSENVTFVDENGDEFSDFDELAGAAEAGGVANPLVPQRYRLTVGAGETVVLREDGVVEPEFPGERSQLVLTKPEFRERADVYAAPGAPADADDSVGDVLGDASERRAITENERVVIGFEATGMWGALAHLAGDDEENGDSGLDTIYENGAAEPDLLADLLSEDEGVSLTIRQTNPDRNEPRTRLDLASAGPSDAYLLFDDVEELEAPGDGPTAGTMYLVIDTAAGAFTEELKPGDEFDVELAFEGDIGERYEFDASGDQPEPFEARSVTDDKIDQQFPYWTADDESRVATTNFTIRERSLTYDQANDNGDLLVDTGAATISGTTTLNPNTELSIEVVSDGGSEPAYSTDDLDIDEDGAFSFTFGAFVDSGTELVVELYKSGDLYDSRTAIAVDDPENPFSFSIEDEPGDLTVTRGDPLSDVAVTVRNEGDIEGRERISLSIGNGALVAEESERLRANRTAETDFARTTADLEPAEYGYTVSVPGDEVTGTIVVHPDELPSEDAAESERSEDVDEADTSDGADDAGDRPESAEERGSDATVPDETGADEEPDGEEPPDEGGDERSGMPLPFGVGAREAFGGTTIVGATYILGHWV